MTAALQGCRNIRRNSKIIAHKIFIVANKLELDEIPLTKSLDISMNFTKTKQKDDHLDKNFIELYREMMKMNKDVDDSLGSEEEKRLKRIVGEDNLMLIKDGGLTRRRALLQRTTSELRRKQNKALRREKLNGQSLRNHLQHINQASRGKQGVD